MHPRAILSLFAALLFLFPAPTHSNVLMFSNLCPLHAPTLCSGFGTWSYDTSTRMVAFEVELSGPLVGTELASHVHLGEETLFSLPLGFPKRGSVGPLSEEQLSLFSSEDWTMDVHTDRFPDGELRGVFFGPDGLKPATWGAVKALFR